MLLDPTIDRATLREVADVAITAIANRTSEPVVMGLRAGARLVAWSTYVRGSEAATRETP
jgi:hypothetical protein